MRGMVRQIGVEGMGRVFTPERGQAHNQLRRHDGIVEAMSLDLPLLRHRQHEIATRSTAAALIESASPGFSSLMDIMARSNRALIRMSFT
jgi:hypothetical protein